MGKQRTTNNEQRTLNESADSSFWTLQEGETTGRKFDLENRLLEFASAVIDLSEKLPASRAGNHVAGQILRSGTSPFPTHGEAESAESRDDFIHKMSICLKELRESRRWLRLIHRIPLTRELPAVETLIQETEELIRIFAKSIKTAKSGASGS